MAPRNMTRAVHHSHGGPDTVSHENVPVPTHGSADVE